MYTHTHTNTQNGRECEKCIKRRGERTELTAGTKILHSLSLHQNIFSYLCSPCVDCPILRTKSLIMNTVMCYKEYRAHSKHLCELKVSSILDRALWSV